MGYDVRQEAQVANRNHICLKQYILRLTDCIGIKTYFSEADVCR